VKTVTCLLACLVTAASAAESGKPATPEADWQTFARIVRAMGDDVWAVRGLDGFCFIKSEMRSYSVGKFWGDASAKTAAYQPDPPADDADPATRAKALKRLARRDPMAAIVSFNAQCKKAGVALILVPVPGKVAIYPDKLDRSAPRGKRLDVHHKAFYAALRTAGVNVLDITDDMLAMRARGVASHCRQDSHWSPQAVRMTARKLAAIVAGQTWYASAKKADPTVKPTKIAVRGDIVEHMLKDSTLPKEKLDIEVVSVAGKAIDDRDRTSPLLLIGDSHALVYHTPPLLARDAGLADLLCAELRLGSIDLVGVMGSGANAPRLSLLRRRDNMKDKACVIWCISAREITESPDGWHDVTVVR